MDEEFKKRDEILKDLKEAIGRLRIQSEQLSRTIENLTTPIEEDAINYLEYKFQSLGYKVELTRLEIEGELEVDIYGEFDDYVIIGETKSRAGVSAVTKLLSLIEKLENYKPEIKGKKKILVIFAISVTRDLINACKERGIYLTNGYRDYTELKL
jgi:hypothetical protein